MKKPTISAVVAVKDEEKNIKECLEGIKGWVDEIIIVDDNSSDNTIKIAKRYTNKIFRRARPKDKSVESNKNFGFSKATKDWILLIDADERIPKETKKEILKKITSSEYDGYSFKFQTYVCGKLLKSPFWENMRIIRLFKCNKGHYSKCAPHELITLNGKLGQLANPFIHYAHPTISSLVKKCDSYSTQNAYQIAKEGKGGLLNKKIKRIGFYNLLVDPLLYTLFLYFWKQNYRDGILGLIISVIFGYSLFLERAKVLELKAKLC